MDVDNLSIKEKVAILQSDLVQDKLSSWSFGAPINNDEFRLTVGFHGYLFLINCEASNITGVDMVGRKYDEEEIQSYTDKFVKLGFMSVHEEGYTVHMDKLKEFYVNTSIDEHTSVVQIDEFLEDMIQCK